MKVRVMIFLKSSVSITYFLSASVRRKEINSAHEHIPLVKNIIDTVLRNRKVVWTKDILTISRT